MAWYCQDCPWEGAWTRRAAHRHSATEGGHQVGGTNGPDWLHRWWWHAWWHYR